MFGRFRVRQLWEEALTAQDAGRFPEAEAAFLRALELDAADSALHYDLGLLYKYWGRWPESLACNKRSLELDPQNEAACWNLGIAATAVGDWATARQAWIRYGIPIAEGEGPIVMKLGLTPIRLGSGEVVWTRRIDPARAVIDSVPFGESGFGWGDTVLHDGAPNGYRVLNGQEVPVFDCLALLAASPFSTWSAEVSAADAGDLTALEELCAARGLGFEDWTTVRRLCKACSEGRPHEQHDHDGPASTSWVPDRRVGLAVRQEAEVMATLEQWRAAGPGRTVHEVKQVLVKQPER